MVPFDERSPFVTSGIRIGTPAATTRGMKEGEMKKVAELIKKVIDNVDDKKVLQDVKENIKKLCSEFPLYP